MQLKINKRSAYAPIRYEATRPYAVSIGTAFLKESKRGAESRTRFIGTQLIPLLKTAVARIGREQGPGPVQSEVGNVQVFGSYLDGGKLIFDVTKTLTQTLQLTDADEIPCGELVFPADSFYLHFGSASGLVDDGLAIEGAFVTRHDDRMTIDLVPQGFGQEHFLFLPMGDSLVGAHVMLDDPAKPVSEALAESVADVLEKNAAVFAQIAEMERQLEKQFGQVVKVPAPVERLAEKSQLLQKAVSLIVNTLFYLAAEPDDVIEDWEPTTPAEALDALRRADKPGAIRTAENTILKAGYSKVRFVGRRFAQSIAAHQIQEATASGKSLATHFRRGHFRRQPYGPERSLRKTIFVAPIVVNAQAGGQPKGKVYDVSPLKS